MKLLFNLLLIMVLGCQEKIVYVYIDIEKEEEVPNVTSSVVNSSTQYLIGTPYVTASGRIKNNGPGIVKQVRLLVTTNHNYSGVAPCSPSTLVEGQVGSWLILDLEGTYIQIRTVLFE